MINPNDQIQTVITLKQISSGITVTIPPSPLTVRAELAARAMQGILSNGEMMTKIGNKYPYATQCAYHVAQLAETYADALIAELNKDTSK